MKKIASFLSRRKMLSTLSLLAVGICGYAAKGLALSSSKKATFVLVHGAWHGGWCWKKVIPLLTSSGHQVYAPTLTGLGERSHLLNKDIGLQTHIKDITSLLDYEDLQDVVLIGHSYAGMVITGVAEKARARLSQLVYLDAFLPENGRSLKDFVPSVPLEEIARAAGEGWRIPLPGKLEDMGVTDKEDLAWMSARVGDHPYKTMTDPILFSDDKSLKKTFIQLSESPWFSEAAERAQKKGYRFYQLLSGGHDAIVSRPKELAGIFKALV